MSVTLQWIPLGAGGRVVPVCGRVYEAICAGTARRRPRRLVHAALIVDVDARRYAVEMAPAWGVPAADRGVRRTGPVGLGPLGMSRFFRYEIRCRPDGDIPDAAYAVQSRVITEDPARSRRVVEYTGLVPELTWGRRAPGTTEMWNSNSAVAWILAMAGLEMDPIGPSGGCRAPGWAAGVELAGSGR
ncbi:hypothetical protein GYA93_12145 [Gordonia desulfuricans]|uniref:Uncharacterized protein n=1 Tax=Gordonia desulfuricans TaxID=89051 RepID=A0A7K3LQ36_9ACTN|nr:hypothetical protein [Gordonia desulfuricans]NDK90328.1 hypothetical protein [Gordonia desulfuricans]